MSSSLLLSHTHSQLQSNQYFIILSENLFISAYIFLSFLGFPLFFLSVTGSRFDIQPAGSKTASIASLALLAVPWSQWDCAKDQTRYQSGVHLLNSPTLLLLCIVSHLCFETNLIILLLFSPFYISFL